MEYLNKCDCIREMGDKCCPKKSRKPCRGLPREPSHSETSHKLKSSIFSNGVPGFVSHVAASVVIIVQEVKGATASSVPLSQQPLTPHDATHGWASRLHSNSASSPLDAVSDKTHPSEWKLSYQKFVWKLPDGDTRWFICGIDRFTHWLLPQFSEKWRHYLNLGSCLPLKFQWFQLCFLAVLLNKMFAEKNIIQRTKYLVNLHSNTCKQFFSCKVQYGIYFFTVFAQLK